MFPMINQPTGPKPNSATNATQSHRHHSVSEEHVKDIIIHAEVSSEFDADKDAAQETPLRMCTDEQLLAELARRKIDVHSHVTDESQEEHCDASRYDETACRFYQPSA
jgi:hypothetical protein